MAGVRIVAVSIYLEERKAPTFSLQHNCDESKVVIPKNALAFKFYMLKGRLNERITLDLISRMGQEKSGYFYIAGEVMSLEGIRDKLPNADVIVADLKAKGCIDGIYAPNKHVYPFVKGLDKVLRPQIW